MDATSFLRRIAGVLFALLFPLSARGVETGQLAPVFEGVPLTAGAPPVRLGDYRGRVVYLDFWASWCTPCRQSLPLYERLRQDLSARGFEVIAVDVDENPQDGMKLQKEIRVSYPLVNDSKGVLASQYDVQVMPSSYLIDRRGVVRLIHRGFKTVDLSELRTTVVQLLEEK